MVVIVLGRVTVANKLKSPFSLFKAKLSIEVKVLETVIEVPSSVRRRLASALVKTVILESKKKKGKAG